jgi:hypothetical protein
MIPRFAMRFAIQEIAAENSSKKVCFCIIRFVNALIFNICMHGTMLAFLLVTY